MKQYLKLVIHAGFNYRTLEGYAVIMSKSGAYRYAVDKYHHDGCYDGRCFLTQAEIIVEIENASGTHYTTLIWE